MATAQSPLARQPDKLDYASPTQFRFVINQLPKVEFFTTAANIPDISLSDVVIPTPFKPIPVLGQNLTYGNLSLTFIVDEFLENYRELHEWLTGIGFPKSRQQFTWIRPTTSKERRLRAYPHWKHVCPGKNTTSNSRPLEAGIVIRFTLSVSQS